MARVKKALLWVVLAFAVYAIVTSPAQAADIVRTGWDISAQGVTSIGDFFNALLRKS